MRKVLLVALVLACLTTGFSQVRDAVADEVLATEHEIASAWDAQNADKLSTFVLDDFRGTTHGGRIIDKQTLLRIVRQSSGGKSKYEHEKVWVHGEIAVYTVKVTDSWMDEKTKKPQQLVTQVTDILLRKDGHWRLKFSQETPVVMQHR